MELFPAGTLKAVMATREERSTDAAAGSDPAADGDGAGSVADVPDSGERRRDRRSADVSQSGSEGSAAELPAVAVSGLSKRFGSGPDAVTAVDDVSVEIPQGEIVGLLGPNGAGKTTLIKSILGMVLPDEGSVRLHGLDVREEPRAAYARVDAMLEGARHDYWRLTVRENLEFFAGIAGNAPSEVRDRHDELLERLTLAEKADEPVRDLSRGMKQKVSLATTLARDVDVAFLDEPTLGLDVESSLELRRELDTLATERDLAVVLSSHDMDVIQDLCDRVVVLSDGEIVADDSVDSLLELFRTQTYEIRLSERPERERRRDLERTFESVSWSGPDRRRLDVTVSDGERLYALFDELETAGVVVESITASEQDLEAAFLQLTDDGDGSADGTDRRVEVGGVT